MKFYSLILFIFLSGLMSCTLDEIPDLTAASTLPVANFEIASQSNNGHSPSTVVFQNTSLNTDTYTWDFGDIISGNNNTSTDKNPSHTYENTGIYTVTLTARNDASGEEDIFTLSVTVGNVITFSNVLLPSAGGASDIVQTSDGGYAIVGDNSSFGNSSILLTLLDAEGNPLPNMPKIYDYSDGDYGKAIIQTNNGGFAIVGYTDNTLGGVDFLLILTDNKGNELAGSPKTFFTSSGKYYANDIIQTNSGGFAIIGRSHHGTDKDVWLVLTDSNGEELLNSPKQFGGDSEERGNAIIQLDNGNLAIVGESYNGTNKDVMLILTDSEGNPLTGSPKIFDGGFGDDVGNDIVETENAGLAICGATKSDASTYNNAWLLLTDSNGNELSNSPKVFDGLNGNDEAHSIIATSNGGFAITGFVTSPDNDIDVSLIFTNENGNELPNSLAYFDHQSRNDGGSSIISTSDGGFAIAAFSFSSTTGTNAWIIKTDEDGKID